MNDKLGFATSTMILTALGIIAIGVGGYALLNGKHSPTPTDTSLISITSPKPNNSITSPIFISGTAQAGWGIFEGQAGTVRLYDGNGKELGMALLTVLGDWTQPEVQFTASLTFASSASGAGKLAFKNDNPSGDPTKDKTYEMEIKFGENQSGREINLFYYNSIRDKALADYMACGRDAVLPVARKIPISQTPIQDAINLLLKGGLTDAEKAAGFQTEFPLSGFSLAGANSVNGTLTLQFNDPQNRSEGGSCRVNLLWASISKTAMQFPEVKEVKFEPSTLFQP